MSIFSQLFPKKKPKAKGIYLPSFVTKVSTGSKINDERVNNTNTDLTSIRYGTTTEEVVRDFSKNSPDISHAVELIMRFCVTDSYRLVAKELETGSVNSDATTMVQSFASRLNRLPRNYDGFSFQSSINATSEALIRQLLTNGTCASELVLDKTALPSHISPISTNKLAYKSKGARVSPYLDDGANSVELDFPAVNIISLSQDPDTPYAESWFKSAVQSVVSSTEFTNDLRKSFRKASLPRVTATVDTKLFKETLSPEVIYDQKKYAEALNNALANIETKLNGLNPEDALVNFDIVNIDHLSAGNSSNHENVDTHAKLVNGQLSNGLHVLPSLLGRGESQSTASTETVLFLKIVESIQDRLNEVFSYHFTLAARLNGHDVTVNFKYKKPSLRPEMEEESFSSMKQSRIMEQLSYGFISDEEASIELTGDLPSGDFTPLSGTRFHGKSAEPVENPYSNTSVSGDQVNNTQEQKDRNKGKTQPKTNKTTG